MWNKKPILVTGAPRSGTTWVGYTLARHGRVWYIHEPFNVTSPNPYLDTTFHVWFTHVPAAAEIESIEAAFERFLYADPLQHARRHCRVAGWDFKTPLRFAKHSLMAALFGLRYRIKDPLDLLSAGWLLKDMPCR